MFSGQGSQYPNMGIDVLSLDKNKEKILLANQIFGFDVLESIKNENDEFSQTRFTQPLTALVSMLLYDELEKLSINPKGFLGFSLGEIVTLYSSKIFSFEDTLKIINFRSIVMEEANQKIEGKMAAVLNFDEDKIIEICNEVNKKHVVSAVNFNSRKQVVISGSILGVDQVMDLLKLEGAKRILPLKVSGGFHTSLMSEAGKKLSNYVGLFENNQNIIPIYLNSNTLELDYKNISNELEIQIQKPVLFYQTIEKLINLGITKFIEIGPGNVLTNLVNKNHENVEAFNIENINDFNKLKGVI